MSVFAIVLCMSLSKWFVVERAKCCGIADLLSLLSLLSLIMQEITLADT